MLNFYFKFRYLYIFLFFLLVVAAAMLRPINQDEPYYNICSEFVSEGKTPYIDFFYQHVPLLVYTYSLNAADGLWGLIAGKIICVVFLFITGIVMAEFLRSKKYEKSHILIFLILCLLNSFLLDWLTIIRVYALSTFGNTKYFVK